MKKRDLLGYEEGEQEPPVELIPFSSKRAKWEWMKDRGLSEVFLEIKEVFGTTEEPIITRRKT
tara:strand:- start:232 stop:420 length:189 start_codon:yes stop_codon:yes gene_type:complete